MATTKKARRSPTLERLVSISQNTNRIAVALERLVVLATQSTGEVFGEPNERFVRVAIEEQAPSQRHLL